MHEQEALGCSAMNQCGHPTLPMNNNTPTCQVAALGDVAHQEYWYALPLGHLQQRSGALPHLRQRTGGRGRAMERLVWR